ncbi:glycosyltransferase family 2 protein [Steroidobacter sp.]|uniref:glycosyltransferase family 2 protein n=1 Tax=Steroidobacter sp. TaxID=1978227 RepID=UPI001A39319A|nr:glycosyltransferase [Steroidobacter sp.]MBL8272027.1 glycosyltransferase [Steroidobacter sp.]
MTNVSKAHISIIITAFNEERDLPVLLASLASLRGDPAFEIIVVDNGSTDGTANRAWVGGAKVVSIERSKVGAGRNAGVKASRGSILAFLDADVIATEQWIASIRALADHARESVITGDVYDIVEQPSWIERHWFGSLYARGAQSYLNGGNLIIARADFAKVGGFDEDMVSGEDVEFCMRAADAGIRVSPDRNLRVLHQGYPSTAKQFINREAWHGRSDFASMRSFLASPVAITAAMFAVLHLTLFVGVLGQYWMLADLSAVGIGFLCLASAVWKWRRAGLTSRLVNAGVFYLYFTGRAVGGAREVIHQAKRHFGTEVPLSL